MSYLLFPQHVDKICETLCLVGYPDQLCLYGNNCAFLVTMRDGKKFLKIPRSIIFTWLAIPSTLLFEIAHGLRRYICSLKLHYFDRGKISCELLSPFV